MGSTIQHAVVAQLSEADYLAGERLARVRHEYVAGELFAMAGASKAHGTLALTVAMVLRTHLRGSPCRTYIAGMKLRVAEAAAYYYPDVLVTCAENDLAAGAPADYGEAPKLVVEVLSPHTEHIDRREKLLAYRRLASLAEYLLIDQERRWVEIYRRADAAWSHDIYVPGDVIEIASVGLSLEFDRLYEHSGVA